MVVNSWLSESPEPSGQRGLGPSLRRAWVGYHLQLLAELKAAGFTDTAFPDGRILRICRRAGDATISRIGRELGITRQGAGKAVASLRDRGYLQLEDSPADGREKIVTLTAHAEEYLEAHRKAARRIEQRLRSAVGADAYQALYALLDVLGREPAEAGGPDASELPPSRPASRERPP